MFRFHEGFGPDVIAAVAFRLSSCFGVSPPQGSGPSVGRGQGRGRMWGRMEIRGGGAGPAVGIRRGEEFIPFATPIVSSEAESPRPEPPRRLRGALLLSPFLGRQEKVSTSDFSNLFCELFRLTFPSFLRSVVAFDLPLPGIQHLQGFDRRRLLNIQPPKL